MIGPAWDLACDRESIAAFNRAIDPGVNFIGTADVSGDGHNRRLISQSQFDTECRAREHSVQPQYRS
jgi:hypothetical protein